MPSTVPELHVAVGVVADSRGRILIAKRADHLHQGGCWEFPGGKVEAGETVEAALARELEEELGLQVSAPVPLLEVRHDYGDRRVRLDVWWIERFAGTPEGRQGQPWRWADVDDLPGLRFPAANAPIVEAVCARHRARAAS